MRSKLLIAMFLAGGILTVVQAQTGGGFAAFAGGGVAQLIVNRAVQDDLKMTDDQVAKSMEWAKEFRTKAMEIRKDKGVVGSGVVFGKGGDKGAITPEQQEKLAAANAEIRKVSYKELGIILKKEQLVRLKQIDRQNMGVNAFTNDEVVAALKLTDTQMTSLKGISDDFEKARREILSAAISGGPDIEKIQDAQKKIQKIQNEYIDKAVALFTDDQKATWKKLKGETFDLQKLVPQFPKKKD
jgi:hypothetical protein